MTEKPDLSPRGWNGGSMAYGASMGRPSTVLPPSECDLVVKVKITRVSLDSQGYDRGGAYWGHGAPLYWAGSEDGTIDLFFRSGCRAMAKLDVIKLHPNARFYR